MSHLTDARGSRISLETVFLAVGQPMEIGIAGFLPTLSVISSQPAIVGVTPKAGSPGRFILTPKSSNKAGVPVIQLMNGTQQWDYFYASVGTDNKVPKAFSDDHNYKHPGRVSVPISIFWEDKTLPDALEFYIEVARMLLEKHGLVLDVQRHQLKKYESDRRGSDNVVLLEDLREKAEKLRKKVDDTGISTAGRLVVIVSAWLTLPAGGEAFGETFKTKDFPNRKNFVILYPNQFESKGLTLLHEMGHAAELRHVSSGTNPSVENFMNDINAGRPPGPDMLKNQVIAIAKMKDNL
ncbi:MAG: hypothetical protein U0X91_05945 [Spirosomataceae bacterium]